MSPQRFSGSTAPRAGSGGSSFASSTACSAYCRARVPYYRDAPGYPAGPLGSLDEVATIPILTKQVVRERNQEFVAEGVDPASCVEFHTSGTTGQRMRVLHDRASYDYMRAGNVRRFFSTGHYTPTSRLTNVRFFAAATARASSGSACSARTACPRSCRWRRSGGPCWPTGRTC